MNEHEITRELQRLSARLRAIEERLGIDSAGATAAIGGTGGTTPVQTTKAKELVEQAERLLRAAEPPVPRASAPIAPATRRETERAAMNPPTAPPTAPFVAPPLAVSSGPPSKAAAFAARQRVEASPLTSRKPGGGGRGRGGAGTGALELFIGGRLMAWVGAVVIVIAAAFFAKMAYDKQWWTNFSPVWRCLMLGGFGAVLMAAGEWALRRIGKPAAAGLFGAGIGVLYATSYASVHLQVVGELGAFALLMLVALAAFAITWRTNFLTIGVLSLIGGYLSPLLIMARSAPFVGALAVYATMLLGVALALSAARPRPFRALRYVALGGQAIVGSVWLAAEGTSHLGLAIVFVTIWWAMVIGEAVLAGLRRQSPLGNAIATLLTTAWFVTAGCWLLSPFAGPAGSAGQWLGAFTLAVGALSAAIAATFGPGIEALRQRPRNAMDKLAVALWAQSGVLLVVAAALQFDGYGQSVSWLAISLASIEIGRRLPSRGLDVFGLIVGALAVARVCTIDLVFSSAALDRALIEFGKVTITGWGVLALATVVAIHMAARRLRTEGDKPWRAMPIVLAVIGTIGWAIWCRTQASGLVVTAGWLAGAVVLLATERFSRRLQYFEIALVLLVATAGRWLIVDALMDRARPGWDASLATPVLNWQMGAALAIAMTGWWAARLLRRQAVAPAPGKPERLGSPGVGWQLALLGGIVVVLIGASFEIDRAVGAMTTGGALWGWSAVQARHLLWTLLWACGSVGVHVLALTLTRGGGERRSVTAPWLLTRFAWAILFACAAKWVIGDTLLWAARGHVASGPMPLANLQMLVGLAVAGAGVLMVMTSARLRDQPAKEPAGRPAAADERIAAWTPPLASIVALWGLSFEIDRALARLERASDFVSPWNATHHRLLWWTALWAAGGFAMMLIGRWRRMPAMLASGWALLAMAAIVWLTGDTLPWRFIEGPAAARVVVNFQFMVGLGGAALLVAAAWMWRGIAAPITEDLPLARQEPAGLATRGGGITASLALAGAIGLWLGSFEIDRYFAFAPESLQANAAMARQVALSIWWGVYGAALIGIGFFSRVPWCRYAGLALLLLTLGKVFVVDMSRVETAYRVLSAAGVGLLFIATSVIYWKLSPRTDELEEMSLSSPDEAG